MSKSILFITAGITLGLTGAASAAAATSVRDSGEGAMAARYAEIGAWAPMQGRGNGQGGGRDGSPQAEGGSRGGGGQGEAQGRGRANRGDANREARQGGSPARSQGAAGQQPRGQGAANRGGGEAADRQQPRGNADVRAGGGTPPGRRNAARGGAGSAPGAGAATGTARGGDRLRIRGTQAVQNVVTRASRRGVPVNLLDVRSDGSRTRVLNRRGETLFDWDDMRGGDLGYWRLRRLGDQQPRAGAPAFCRSGAGHPVWGREWCLDRRFGLGRRSGILWSRGTVDDVVFGRLILGDRLDRGSLLEVLGTAVVGRIALQALGLGYTEPLTGYWVDEPQGPRLLRVRSGDYEVAEFVDLDRDDRVEVLYVAQPSVVVVR